MKANRDSIIRKVALDEHHTGFHAIPFPKTMHLPDHRGTSDHHASPATMSLNWPGMEKHTARRTLGSFRGAQLVPSYTSVHRKVVHSTELRSITHLAFSVCDGVLLASRGRFTGLFVVEVRSRVGHLLWKQYAVRSPAGSSRSTGAGCAVVCTISSAGASWCPREG